MLPPIVKLLLPVYVLVFWLGFLVEFLINKPVAETVKVIRKKSFLITRGQK